jgi:hypothetical protein
VRGVVLPLVGSVVLTAFSIAALPFSQGLFRAPRTPYGESPAWTLLRRADPLIPHGTSVLVRVEPPDPVNDTHLHRFGVGLLPGRKIVPAALWDVPAPPEVRREAEYEIVVGKMPQPPPGQLLLEMPEGTIWRRQR